MNNKLGLANAYVATNAVATIEGLVLPRPRCRRGSVPFTLSPYRALRALRQRLTLSLDETRIPSSAIWVPKTCINSVSNSQANTWRTPECGSEFKRSGPDSLRRCPLRAAPCARVAMEGGEAGAGGDQFGASRSQLSIGATERPGVEPRRHLYRAWQARGGVDRSTKAGGLNPGDTRPQCCVRISEMTLNEGRGLNPGDTTRAARCLLPRCTLNEGRGLNPGDTGVSARPGAPSARAQRRPGVEPRRHEADEDEARDIAIVAQRRPGVEPRRHASFRKTSPFCVIAQRRPGVEPRRHWITDLSAVDAIIAQRRPGVEPRRHLLGLRHPDARHHRSTKAEG